MKKNSTLHRIMATIVVATTFSATMMAGNVATGSKQTYWVKNDGTLWAWGRNQEYQLSDRSNTERREPVQSTDQSQKLTGCLKVITGIDCAFLIKSDGTLWAWGSGSKGQTGIGSNEQKWATQIEMGYRQKVRQLVTSNLHTLAVTYENELYTWGDNQYGQLGDEQGASFISKPRQRLSEVPIALAAVGSDHSLALSTDGKLYAWGRNHKGQLCDGTTTNHPQPVLVMSDVADVTADEDYTAVIKTNGSLLVNKTAGWQMTRMMDGGAASAVITSGRIYIITKTQELWACDIATEYPAKIMDNVKRVVAKGKLAYAIRTDETLWQCNGTPKQLMDNVSKVATSGDHTVALKHDGTLYTWGRNEQGQLGIGSHKDQDAPIQVGKDYTPETQGISETTVNAIADGDGRIFNLQGQQVTTTKKGLYIIGGKKIMVK